MVTHSRIMQFRFAPEVVCEVMVYFDETKNHIHVLDLDRGRTVTNAIDEIQLPILERLFPIRTKEQTVDAYEWYLYHTDNTVSQFSRGSFAPVRNKENLFPSYVEMMNELYGK